MGKDRRNEGGKEDNGGLEGGGPKGNDREREERRLCEGGVGIGERWRGSLLLGVLWAGNGQRRRDW